MKKKEVIAAVAFHEVPPSIQIEGQIDLPSGLTVTPSTPQNTALQMGAMIKQVLEAAVSSKTDDDTLNAVDFDQLGDALIRFQDTVLEAMIMPEIQDSVREEFAARMAVLLSLWPDEDAGV